MSRLLTRRGAVALTALTAGVMALGVVQRLVIPQARGSFDGLTLLPMLVALAAVGGLVAVRRPDTSYGWVLSAVALTWSVNGVAADYAAAALARGWVGVWPATLATVATAALSWGTFVTFVLLLYPTGTLPTPRWRWIARGAAVGLVCMTVGLMWTATKVGAVETMRRYRMGEPVTESGAAAALNGIGHVLVFAALIAGVISLVMRHRRADTVQRLQLKWFAFGAALVAVSILLAPLFGEAAWLEVVAITVMPVVIGVAILRWHLYDIDRIVSRSLGYAVLTLLLVGIYLGAVTTLTTMTAPVTRDSPIAVAAATLLAAAVFQPARRRIQSTVDRRFNRSRYDAQRTVTAFASSLRSEVDLDDVHRHLVQTVDEVLQPSSVNVWLSPRSAS